MRYHRLGELPRKRHTQFRTNGRLLVEEVMGLEGFSGNESILYHHTSLPDLRRRRLRADHPRGVGARRARPPPPRDGRDPCGRRPDHRAPLPDVELDLEVSICRPDEETDAFYRSGDGDELIFVHEGSGELETIFGTSPTAGTTTSSSLAEPPTASGSRTADN